MAGQCIRFDKPPSSEEVHRTAKESAACDDLHIIIGYDFFPTSAGELDLSFLHNFEMLSALTLQSIAGLKSLEFIRDLPSLRRLTIGQTKSKKLDLSPLKFLHNLEELHLDKQQYGIEVLSELNKLTYLSLQSVVVPTLDFLSSLQTLRGLRLALGATQNLSALRSTNVRYLQLWQIRSLSDADLSPICGMTKLQYLFLDKLKHITSLPDFSACDNLRVIHFEGMASLTNITSLTSASNLEEIRIADTKKLKPDDFVFLRNHPSLRRGFIGTGTDKGNLEAAKILPLEPPTPIPTLIVNALAA